MSARIYFTQGDICRIYFIRNEKAAEIYKVIYYHVLSCLAVIEMPRTIYEELLNPWMHDATINFFVSKQNNALILVINLF